MRSFRHDTPIASRSDDLLSRANFATKLAEALLWDEKGSGVIVAIDGSWGSGKSTILNFVSESIENDEIGGEAHVVRFNPWGLAPESNVPIALLDQIAISLGLDRRIAKALKRYVRLLSGYAKDVPEPTISTASRWLHLVASQSPTIQDAKDRLGKQLANHGKRIVVLVDDVDRLNADEIVELFSALKVVADFENTTYVLACDVNQITHQLESRFSGTGPDYVDKLIQVVFPVPKPRSVDLESMVLASLEELVASPRPVLFDPDEWAEVFRSDLSHFFRNPRDVVRFTNTVQLCHAPVEGEVNLVDFMLFQALRVFQPKLLDDLLRNRELLGHPRDEVYAFINQKYEEEKYSIQLKELLDIVPDDFERSRVSRIVARLFPYAGKLLKEHPPHRDASLQKTQRRIADKSSFDAYVGLSLHEDLPSLTEVDAALNTIADRKRWARLMQHQGGIYVGNSMSRISVLLPEVDRQVETLNSGQCETGLAAVLWDSDKWWNEDAPLVIGRPRAESAIVGLAMSLFGGIEQDRKLEAARAAIRSSESTLVPTLFARRIGVNAGVQDGSSVRNLDSPVEAQSWNFGVTTEILRMIEVAAAERIQAAAEGNALLSMPRCMWLIAEWWRWDESGAFDKWFNDTLADDAALLDLLRSARHRDMRRDETEASVHADSFKEYCSTDQMLEAVKRMKESVATEEATVLAAEFEKSI